MRYLEQTLSGGIGFYTTNTSNVSDAKMYIINNGDVGIGTTEPSQKLHVNGNVKASKFLGELESDKVRTHISVTDNGGELYINYASDYIL